MNFKNKCCYLLIILFFTGFYASDIFCQEVELSGVIVDSLENSLENANVFAVPFKKQNKIKFSTTDRQGKYILKLKQGISYTLQISYLGYESYKDSIRLRQDGFKKITLFPSNKTLEEIILTERTPIKIRQDTITYRPEKFLTGEERKLRDVLKKLPGLEVDRAGNVTVNGKPVTKLLVDGKEFFTGDEKLGVNNIPADVVDEIEALDNYNDVAFLKGLSDSEQLALNIKLKEGNKKFAFGELEAGGGVEERYIAHPTLFYYSPKTSVNAIGDFNNIGQKSFTVQDYIDFEGGFTRLGSDPQSYFSLFTDDFAQFLSQGDFIFNRNNFGALSLNQSLTNKTTLSAYSILSNGAINTRQENIITYTTSPDLDENRITTQDNELFFTLSKASLRYIGDSDLDIDYETFLKTNRGQSSSILNSTTQIDTTFLDQNNKPTNTDITQKLSVNKRFNRQHTSSLNISHKYAQSDNTGNWIFDRPIFTNLIPIEDDGNPILLRQIRENRGHDTQLNLKHYWVLHRFHHIYPEIGAQYINQSYTSNDFQLIDNTINEFDAADFNNDIDFKLLDSYSGFQYKAKAGKFIFKPGLFLHHYTWTVDQSNLQLLDQEKAVLLPQLSVDWEITSSHKLKLKYNLNSRFGQATQYANRLRFQSFNQLFRGNEQLENELYHSASLRYSKFSLFKGLFYNAGISYTNRVRSIRNNTAIEGIDQVNTLIYTGLPENSYRGNFTISKVLNDVKVSISGNGSLSEYDRLINGEVRSFQSQNYLYTAGAKTTFKNAPNFDLKWRQTFNVFESDNASTSRFTQISPEVDIEYRFLKDFVFEGRYNFNYYENRNLNAFNRFSLANLSLLYAQEDSLWTIKLAIDNIFNTAFKRENSFNQFFVNDSRTFIQPLTAILSVSYKF